MQFSANYRGREQSATNPDNKTNFSWSIFANKVNTGNSIDLFILNIIEKLNAIGSHSSSEYQHSTSNLKSNYSTGFPSTNDPNPTKYKIVFVLYNATTNRRLSGMIEYTIDETITLANTVNAYCQSYWGINLATTTDDYYLENVVMEVY